MWKVLNVIRAMKIKHASASYSLCRDTILHSRWGEKDATWRYTSEGWWGPIYSGLTKGYMYVIRYVKHRKVGTRNTFRALSNAGRRDLKYLNNLRSYSFPMH